jgi:hypothetical protein
MRSLPETTMPPQRLRGEFLSTGLKRSFSEKKSIRAPSSAGMRKKYQKHLTTR